jgi:16S rRNA (adenine1518-N6/adenine1519-N6)-dimethyltransferase
VIEPLPPLRDVLAAYGLEPKKQLGQNFLLDMNLTRRIARAGGPWEGFDALEIGPGPGGLTRALLLEGAGHVTVVERDARCLPALEAIAAAYPGRVSIVAGDALEFAEGSVRRPVRIAANLPYNIGSALLVKWLTASAWPPVWSSLTLMFQREVAERLVAAPNTSAYGRLSVLTQWRSRAEILFDVNPAAFTPPPKVVSSVVRIEPLERPVAPARLAALEAVTAAAFGQRRKMLRGSLKTVSPAALTLCQSAGVNPEARAEDLSVAQFASLARALDAARPGTE